MDAVLFELIPLECHESTLLHMGSRRSLYN
jgi:hypothetical protein